MSIEVPFTKENLDICLSALAKEFRKLNGKSMPAEIILIGGASILANYGFRDVTYDMDAIIYASSAMKEAINRVGDRMDLPNGWLNTDFKTTKSYSGKLAEISVYYKTFSNILTVRTVSSEYLVAMKLMSGRQYKNDLSDIVGILWEHQKRGTPISYEAVDQAVGVLYGGWKGIPPISQEFIKGVFVNGDYYAFYMKIRESEQDTKSMLIDFEEKYPHTLNESNINAVIEQAKRKRESEHKKSIDER